MNFALEMIDLSVAMEILVCFEAYMSMIAL
jgi:hypothetical protein